MWKVELEGLEGKTTSNEDVITHEPIKNVQARGTPFVTTTAGGKLVQETTKEVVKRTIGQGLGSLARAAGSLAAALLFPQTANAPGLPIPNVTRNSDGDIVPLNSDNAIDEKLRVDNIDIDNVTDNDSPVRRIGESESLTEGFKNTLNHIFDESADHQLDNLLKEFDGSQVETFKAVEKAANEAFKKGQIRTNSKGILPSGDSGIIIKVAGQNVRLIGGRVIDGEVKISSFSQRNLNN